MRFGLKIGFGFIGICSLAISLIYARYYALPHPDQANRNQLGYWLVLKDLESEPEETRIALVNRLIDEADLVYEAGEESLELSDAQSRRLIKNVEILKSSWFIDRVDQHHKLPQEKQWGFLCEQIDVVNRWVSLLMENPQFLSCAEDADPQSTPAELFFCEIDQWIADAPAEKHDLAVHTLNNSVYVWLATEPLSIQTMGTRRELANRIACELERGMKLESNSTSISSSEQVMLSCNGQLLMEAWMHQLADELAQIENNRKRIDFVDQLIVKIRAWGILEAVQVHPSTGADQEPSEIEAILHFTKLVEGWIEQAEPGQQQKLDNFYRLTKTRIMAAMFNGTFLKS